MTKKSDKIDLVLIIIWPIIATLVSYYFKLNFFTATVVYMGLPSLYLSLKHLKQIKKIIIFALGPLPLLVVLDYVSITTGTWYFPTSVFSHRLFNVVTFEVLFWYFLYVYFIVIFYEHFLEPHCRQYITKKRYKLTAILFIIILALFLATMLIKQSFIKVPYWYAVIGVIFGVIPITLALVKHPKLIGKFALVTIYFSIMSFMWELVAVPNGQWAFPGKSFIGWVTIYGVTFPFEEFLVWTILGAAAILSFYEVLDDDDR